jgi:hypothetical protein
MSALVVALEQLLIEKDFFGVGDQTVKVNLGKATASIKPGLSLSQR